jgi:hypothetical protein
LLSRAAAVSVARRFEIVADGLRTLEARSCDGRENERFARMALRGRRAAWMFDGQGAKRRREAPPATVDR